LAPTLGVDLVAIKDPHSGKSLFSQSWYRVSDLRPRLRSHARFHRHTYRDRDWYILQDHSTGRFHRFSPEAYLIIGLMDGRHTLDEIWKTACDRLDDDMPTQDEVIDLLAYLHQADTLQSDIPPDIKELHQRGRKEKRGRWMALLRSPAYMNFALLDPDAFLEKTLFLVRPFFSRAGLFLWIAIVSFALVQVGIHWRELTANATDRVLSLQNLFVLGLIYPVTRIFHEFGHAYAVKRWGGEVHEMGIMLIAFMPIPYMDASSSSAFYYKGRRIMVSAAGIMVDLLLAACGVIVWINAEPGMARVIAYNVILIGGVSTLFLNGNPLLRFDAYYILADYLEIPNMASRGNQYVGYLLQRYLLGIREAKSPVQAAGEGPWLFLYAIAAFGYRILISISIILFIAGRFFVLGVVLALWTSAAILFFPLVKIARHVLQNMRRSLSRVLLAAVACAALLAGILFWVPFPSFTVAEGVIWAPDEARVFSGTDGFVVKILVSPGSRVSKGEPLFFCEAPGLRAELKVLRAGLMELEARYRMSFVTNKAEAQVLQEGLASARAKLARAEERFGELVVRSPASGVLLMPKADDMPGSFVQKGMPVGYVVDFSKTVVRVVVSQVDVDYIRYRTRNVEGRLAASVDRVYPARIEREVPEASRELPGMALSLEGGGGVALDPKQTDKPQSFEKLFHFDIALDRAKVRGIGERVYVRFEHDPEPLAFRLHRSVRRLLLKQFGV
jgi:putative peptide zinc metalloprotease protein